MVGWAAIYLAFLAMLIAISYPLVTGGAIALALVTAFGIRLLQRRRDHRTRRVCIPATGICVTM